MHSKSKRILSKQEVKPHQRFCGSHSHGELGDLNWMPEQFLYRDLSCHTQSKLFCVSWTCWNALFRLNGPHSWDIKITPAYASQAGGVHFDKEAKNAEPHQRSCNFKPETWTFPRLTFLIDRWENWSPDRLNDLPRVTQLVKNGAGIRTRVLLLPHSRFPFSVALLSAFLQV